MLYIRNAKPEDAHGIQTVFYATWLATYPNEKIGITQGDIHESFKDSFSDEKIKEYYEKFKHIPENSRLLVVEDSETKQIVGLARIIIREEYNQLQAIYVLPEYQGKGIGFKLWNEALRFFDEKKDTVVHVATYNTNAISFYTSLGFTDTGKRFSEERHRMPISKVLIPEMEMLRKAHQE